MVQARQRRLMALPFEIQAAILLIRRVPFSYYLCSSGGQLMIQIRLFNSRRASFFVEVRRLAW